MVPKAQMKVHNSSLGTVTVPFYSEVGDIIVSLNNYPYLVSGGTIQNFVFEFLKLQNGTTNYDIADLCVSAVLVPLN